MAVYTPVAERQLKDFLAAYDCGALQSYEGIRQGVENTNFHVWTDQGRFILTLFEKRTKAGDLPFFFDFMAHLAGRGVACPLAVPDGQGHRVAALAGKPAALITFLDGQQPDEAGITPGDCRALGMAVAGLHAAAHGFAGARGNALSLDGWRVLARGTAAGADTVETGLARLIAGEMDFLERSWPSGLPAGVVHADIFPDNVFFADGRVSGFIDFYFSCTDAFAYDLALVVNAWCFDTQGIWQAGRFDALLDGYNAVRPLSDPERTALPVLCRGAAMRILLTRLHDWLTHDPGDFVVPKDRATMPLNYGFTGMTESRVEIFTDGACSGNPGPGGWGAILRLGGSEKELSGGENPTTNNRMEMLAAISALEALKRPCAVDLYTDSQYLRQGVHDWMPGWKKKNWPDRIKNQDLWRRLDALIGVHDVTFHWVRGHDGHPENERCDELARQAVKAVRGAG